MRFDRSFFAAPRAACALLFVAAALLAGCSSKNPVRPPLKPLSRVVITTGVDTLAVGGQFQFVATAYDTNDVATGEVGITWKSTDVAVLVVGSSGLATAVGEGSTHLIASANGKADTALVYVRSATRGWYVQPSNTTANLDAIYFQPDGHTGFAVGAVGTIVATSNAGATWTGRGSGTVSELTSVWFSSTTNGWATGKGGVLVRTTNGGTSWTRVLNLVTSENLECVRFADASHGWIVGGTGNAFVARTRDGGATWSTRTFGGAALYSVSFADTSNGWAVGAGVIYGTRDGGASWYLVQPSVTTQTLRGIARLGDTQAWGVGGQGTIVSTAATVDSLAWSLASAGANYQLNAIHMLDANRGWIAGSNLAQGAILATANGGTTWTPQVSASTVGLNGIWFADGLRGWAVGATGRIVHTSTGGQP